MPVSLRRLISSGSQAFYIIAGFLIVVTLGVFDYVTGPMYAFSIFYLIPVLMVTWYTRQSWGWIISIVSALICFLSEILSPHRYASLAVPLWNIAVNLGFFLFFYNILSRLKSAHQREREMARTDPLTGIANSRFFYERVAGEINRAKRTNEPMTFVYLDVDNFKDINDTHGHSGGDTLLRLIAATLTGNIRAMDILARIGGDEFILLLPNTGFDEAQTTILRLQKNLLETLARQGWPVTFCFGMVTCLKPPANVDDMIKAADRLMYAAKKRGKNTICHETFNPA